MRKARILLIPIMTLLAYVFLLSPVQAIYVQPVHDAGDQVEPAGPDLDLRHRMEIAYPPTLSGVNNTFYRNVNDDMQDWPPMNFVGEPVTLDGRIFTVEDVKIISGSTATRVYLPETDQAFEAPNGAINIILEMPTAFIPPNSSLVMVNILVEPSFEVTELGCASLEGDPLSSISPIFLRISYPGAGESRVLDTFVEDDYDFGPFNSPADGCLNSGWYYFYLPVIDPKPQEIWLEYVDVWDPELFRVWTLIRYH